MIENNAAKEKLQLQLVYMLRIVCWVQKAESSRRMNGKQVIDIDLI